MKTLLSVPDQPGLNLTWSHISDGMFRNNVVVYYLQISRVGKVGNRKLYLKEDSETSYSILTISEIPPIGRHSTVDPILEKVIVYLD